MPPNLHTYDVTLTTRVAVTYSGDALTATELQALAQAHADGAAQGVADKLEETGRTVLSKQGVLEGG